MALNDELCSYERTRTMRGKYKAGIAFVQKSSRRLPVCWHVATPTCQCSLALHVQLLSRSRSYCLCRVTTTYSTISYLGPTGCSRTSWLALSILHINLTC